MSRYIRQMMRFIQKKREALSLPRWLNSSIVKIALVVVILFTGVLYVRETMVLATTGYEIHALEQEIASINNELQRLTGDIAVAQSMVQIQNRLPEQNMVAVAAVKRFTSNADVVIAQATR